MGGRREGRNKGEGGRGGEGEGEWGCDGRGWEGGRELREEGR